MDRSLAQLKKVMVFQRQMDLCMREDLRITKRMGKEGLHMNQVYSTMVISKMIRSTAKGSLQLQMVHTMRVLLRMISKAEKDQKISQIMEIIEVHMLMVLNMDREYTQIQMETHMLESFKKESLEEMGSIHILMDESQKENIRMEC